VKSENIIFPIKPVGTVSQIFLRGLRKQIMEKISSKNGFGAIFPLCRKMPKNAENHQNWRFLNCHQEIIS
jgi:hypothetical protein